MAIGVDVVMVVHSARSVRWGLTWSLAAASGAAWGAPVGFDPRPDPAGARVHLSVVLLADDAGDPRREATATRRLLEITHQAGLWPVQLAVTPASLTGMLTADPDLARLVSEVRPTILLVGPDPPDDGLKACGLVGAQLGVIPALGGGRVGALLREDTPMAAAARSLEADGLVRVGGLIPPGRLAAGRPDPDAPAADIDRWRAAWATAAADAGGVSVPSEDAERVLDDLAQLAALSSSVGLDPFRVPGVAARLSAPLRSDRPAHAWSAAPLQVEVRSLEADLATDPEGTLGQLQGATATLARHVAARIDPAVELAERVAELPPDGRYRATQVLRARDLRAGPSSAATEARVRAAALTLGQMSDHVAIDPARIAENTVQWSTPASDRWAAVFHLPPHRAAEVLPEELHLLHRDFKRRELRRRARER